MSGVFITGTDTGVGKTFVSCALLHAARARGWSVRGVKAVESGCAPGADGLVAADAAALGDAAGHAPCCGARFEAAASPARAAALRGTELSLDAVSSFVRGQLDASLCVVEGAGGLLVPLSPTATMADLAAELKLPVIVVARDALGTVNHCLLTIAAAGSRGLDVRAVVFSGRPGEHAAVEDSAQQVQAFTGLEVWHLPEGEPAATHGALADLLDVLVR